MKGLAGTVSQQSLLPKDRLKEPVRQGHWVEYSRRSYLRNKITINPRLENIPNSTLKKQEYH